MNQCKTQADLHRKMAEVYDFCRGTMLEGREYLCVKYNGDIEYLHPRFNLIPASYEFALSVVEDKRVWENDTLYARGIPVVVKQRFGEGFILADGTRIGKEVVLTWNPPAPPKPKTIIVSVNGGESITLDQMVDRFLGWRLPEHFHPDAGIVFTKPEKLYPLIEHPEHLWPTGTNLFDADQAKAMILYLLEENCDETL